MRVNQNRMAAETVNVHEAERWLSVLGGGALAIHGLSKGRSGFVRAIAGAIIMKRGITGHCEAYSALGIRTAPPSDDTESGIRARGSVTVEAPREKIYEFWRNLENLPRLMRFLVSVETGEDDRISHWVALGPRDRLVKWDAEIVDEVPNQSISWRSLPGADVSNAGSVTFKDAPGGRGTEIRAELQYNPPGGVLGSYFARLFGREPGQEIRGDLARLKQYFETGEIATTDGQSVGEIVTGRTTGQAIREALA